MVSIVSVDSCLFCGVKLLGGINLRLKGLLSCSSECDGW